MIIFLRDNKRKKDFFMAKLLSSLVFIISLNSFAAINLNIDLKQKHLNNTTKKNIEVSLADGIGQEIKFKDQIIVVTASEDIPEKMANPDIIVGQILVDVKIYNLEKNKRVLINNPQILTLVGEQSSIEIADSESSDKLNLDIIAKIQ